MSSDPVLAYHDEAFLDSDEGRPLRILAEYLAKTSTSWCGPAVALARSHPEADCHAPAQTSCAKVKS